MSTFLPIGYESLRTEKAYWKMSQMKDGDNRLRILGQPIAGWVDWIDNKPVRYRPDGRPPKAHDPEKPVRAFWAMHVWDYAREGLFILEITQSSILKALAALGNDEDWGDFTKFDIKVTKTGTGKDTRYQLTPLPHKPLAAKIMDAVKSQPVRLEALYEGRDPWKDFDAIEMDRGDDEADPIEPEISGMTRLEELRELLEMDSMDPSLVEAYISELATQKGQATEVVIDSALLPQLLPKFKAAYSKYLQKVGQAAIAV